MARSKYFYNPETCQYERVKIKENDVIFNFLGLFTAALLLAVVIMIVFNTYFDTPREASLKKDNSELTQHYADMLNSMDEIEAMNVVLNLRDHQIHSKLYDGDPMDGKLIDEGILPSYPSVLAKEGFTNKKALDKFFRNISLLNEDVSKNNAELTEYMNIAVNKVDQLQFIPTIQPIDNSELNALVTGFGKRINPYHHGIVEHEGIDFSVPRGTPLHTTATGRVVLVKRTEVKTGYGNRVEIDHGNGFITRYTHLDEIFVKKGEHVLKGATIATVGLSGGTIAPCLHYEIIRNGKHVNPVNFFIEGVSEDDYVTLLELALRENQSLD